jgi:hypothetical protein
MRIFEKVTFYIQQKEQDWTHMIENLTQSALELEKLWSFLRPTECKSLMKEEILFLILR